MVTGQRYRLLFCQQGQCACAGVHVLIFRRFKEFFSTALELMVEEGASLELVWLVLFDH